MPSFVSAAAELRDLAKKWRVGQRAYNDMFDVLPREEGQVYGEVRLKDTPTDPYHRYVFEDCNEQWCKQEVQRRTKNDRYAIKQAKQSGVKKEELRAMRKLATRKQALIQQQLTESNGLLGKINNATKSSEAANAKAFLILCLGEYIQTVPREAA